ncbi:MAG TPA: hypothetical protein VFM88_09490 [Vicinamibacteria bacterium]|nr:hypothetical protein [Vicinamibacteria bacterium]
MTLLAILWMIGMIYYPVATVLTARGASGLVTAVTATIGVLGTLTSGLLAWGLWSRQAWARFAQIALAILGLFTCLFTPASAAILAYMFRGDVASHFSDRRPEGTGAGEDGRLEPYFTAVIAGLIVLPMLLGAALSLLQVFSPALLPANR